MPRAPGIWVWLLAAWLAGSLCSCKAIDGLIAFVQIGQDLRVPGSSPPARMDIVGDTPVIHLYGGPRERGRQYGRLLQHPLQALDRCITDFLTSRKHAQLLAYARSREPGLPAEVRDELHAISDASGVPYIDLVILNVTPTLACSALATWPDPNADATPSASATNPPVSNRPLIMGRNANYFTMGFNDRGMVVVVCHRDPGDESLPMVSVNFLGMIGAYTGMNARGVAFGNMLVLDAPENWQGEGLAIQLALRLAADRAATADEMAERLGGQKHVIPMNVMIADSHHALAMELDPNGCRIRQGDRGVLVSTNHFMKQSFACPEDSCVRYDKLLAAGRASGGAMTVEQMKQALWAARGKDNVQAVVFEPSRLRMHVSINHFPASGGPYIVLDLHDLFSPRELGLVPATGAARDEAH